MSRCAVLCLLLLGLLAGCGSSGAGSTPSAAPATTAATGAPAAVTPTAATATAPAATATPAPSGPYTLTVPSIALSLTMTPLDCLSGQSAAPLGRAVLFVDCTGFVFILAARGGPLDGLAGTTATLTWVDGAGTTVNGTLDGTTGSLPRSDTGLYSGHGAAAKSFFVQLRSATAATELPGKIG